MTTAVDDRPAETTTPADARPIHLAKCGECAQAVRFRPTASGASFILIDAAPDASYGIGENGRPMCPDGHGEMTVADDQLKPASEAIADVAARVAAAAAADGPVQALLPGVFPAFNYPGIMKELEDQALLVRVLEQEHGEDARVAKESKKKLDEAKDKLVAMTLVFRDRRRAKEAGLPDPAETGARSPRLVKCTWEAKHPDDKCPLCDDEFISPMVLQEIFGNADQLPPADAEAHVDAADHVIVWTEMREAVEALEGIDTFIPDALVSSWTSDERKAVTLYADRELDLRADSTQFGGVHLERPAVLGRPHIPAAAVRTADGDGYAPQECSICGEVLPREDDTDAFQVTDFVGVDCSGKPKKATGPEHHYPATGKKKPAAKAGKKPATKAKT